MPIVVHPWRPARSPWRLGNIGVGDGDRVLCLGPGAERVMAVSVRQCVLMSVLRCTGRIGQARQLDAGAS